MSSIWIKGTLFKFRQRLIYSNLAIVFTILFYISGIVFGEILYIDSLAYTSLILSVIFSFIYGISIYMKDEQTSIEIEDEIDIIDNMINSNDNMIDNMINNINEITDTTKEKITSNTNYVIKKQVKKKHHPINYGRYYNHKKFKK